MTRPNILLFITDQHRADSEPGDEQAGGEDGRTMEEGQHGDREGHGQLLGEPPTRRCSTARIHAPVTRAAQQLAGGQLEAVDAAEGRGALGAGVDAVVDEAEG